VHYLQMSLLYVPNMSIQATPVCEGDHIPPGLPSEAFSLSFQDKPVFIFLPPVPSISQSPKSRLSRLPHSKPEEEEEEEE